MATPLPRRSVLALVCWVALTVSPQVAIAQETVTVFAASSLKTALDEVAAQFEQASDNKVRLSYAGSSALARQIQHGAPAQIFVSANADWMDLLDSDGLVVADTRIDLLTNRLVLIAAPDTDVALTIAPGFDLAGALGDNRLAMALINAVPAGIYGRNALQFLGVWSAVQPLVAQADNVTATLMLVAIGEAPMGIVYATDAMTDPRVRVLGTFPPDSHPEIRYPAAIVQGGDTVGARAFLAFLTGAQGRAVFQQHGFGRPKGGS